MNDVQALTHDATTFSSQALTLVAITGPSTLELAAQLRTEAKRRLKVSSDFFDPDIASADRLHKDLLAKRRMVDAPYLDALAHLNPLIGAYMAAQESARKIAEAALTAQATANAEATQVAVAAHLEASGDHVAAAQVMAQPIVVAPVSLPKVKADGVMTRTDWDFTIDNISIVPREYLVVDLAKVRQVVRALRGQTQIPGIKAFSKQTVVGGGRT